MPGRYKSVESIVEELISAHKAVWGNKFDYSSLGYRKYDEKVAIICPRHGPLQVFPDSMKKGYGCKKCTREDENARNREAFIASAQEVHGGKYDYSKVVYKNARTNVTIICPEHGPFPQVPNVHINTLKCGCPKCGRIAANKAKEFHPEPGQKFGGLIAIEFAGYEEKPFNQKRGAVQNRVLWRWRCTFCGNQDYIQGPALVKNMLADGFPVGCGCRRGGHTDGPQAFVRDPEWGNSDCMVYIADIDEVYLKPGITNDLEVRARSNRYKGYLFTSPVFTRIEAWTIEQCLLQDAAAAHPGVEAQEAYIRRLPASGYKELRLKSALPVGWYVSRYHELVEQLHERGWEEICLERGFKSIEYEQPSTD